MRLLPVLLLAVLVAPLALSAPTLHAEPLPPAPRPPAWYTEDVHARVLAASERGLAYDVEAGLEASVPPWAFIRPGAGMVSPALCTMGFVFGTPGAYKISTAGRCAPNKGEVVVLRAAGPTTPLVAIGRVVETYHDETLVDWALVSVYSAYQAYVTPCVATLLGPEGAYAGGAPQAIKWVADDGASPREGLLTSFGADVFHGAGPMVPSDAGAPVLAPSLGAPLGEAVGTLSGILVAGPGGANLGGVRLHVIPTTLATCVV